FSHAADTFTRLTVGDGLVTQIPAIIVSTAAGLMVSKGGLTETMDSALSTQFTQYPKALGMSALLAGSLALLPGTPALPFLLLAAVTGGIAAFVSINNKREET